MTSTGTRDARAVVVGVDDSASARDAAGWAADLAAAWDAPLQLVHVADGPVGGQPAPEVPDWLRELADAADQLGVREVGSQVAPHDAADVLVARSAEARLLVVGSYGPGARAGMLAGDTALALLAHARCPVAVVRGRAPGVPPARSGPVVAGVDGSAAGDAALALAAELAASLGAQLVAVHTWSDVVADPSGGLHRSTEDRASLSERGNQLLEARLAPVRARHPGVAIEPHVVENTPLRAILDRAEHARAVVVGHRVGVPRDGVGLGSTSRGLVQFAPCPVIVIRGPQPRPEPAPE